ncbi:GMC family oxidoreductase N-terminal domain-containing protein [Corynebacterium sp. USCH3]|uniref:GMC family oxidoreductase n=1 Tax=Corynebacterium sp. USCH3 TaxID=3024840 RepID=UPI0030A7A2E5
MDGTGYIVVGAGSAGCVVARRLIDAGEKVTVVEAGGYDENPLIETVWSSVMLWHGPEDWDFQTVPQEHCGGRRLHLPRGKVTGGSHALNGTIWCRGSREDYDTWAYLGCPGWSWDDVLPTFRRIENFDGGGSALRGEDGLLDVSQGYTVNPIQESILSAGTEIGLPLDEDYNDGAPDGISRMQLNVRDGKRFTTWRAYLKPVLGHENLTVVTGAEVDRLVIEAGAVTGIEYIRDGRRHTLHAGETILATGALGSPAILLRSGIGPADELLSAGVQPVVDLPGVGKNLQDHLLVPVVFTTSTPVPPPSTGVAETHHFWRSRPDLAVPDTQPIHFSIPMYLDDMTGPENGFSLVAGLVRPQARGSVTLSGPDVSDELLIDLAALDNDVDVSALVASVRQCRRMGRAPSLAEWGAQEMYPGNDVGDDDDALEKYVRAHVGTYHHQVGTCRMGVDAGSVVDPRTLAVRGVTGLRVADASVMPLVTTGNTNAAAVLVGERAAGFIVGGPTPDADTASDTIGEMV